MAAYMAVDSNPLPRLWPDTDPPAAAGRRHRGPPAGAEQLRVQPDRLQGAVPVPQGRVAVIKGDLITLPFSGGLLYMEPIYIGGGRRAPARARTRPETGVRCLRR